MIDQSISFLVVEDNDLDVEKIERGFKRVKICNDLIRAKDGLDALDILRGTNGQTKLKSTSVILLDLNMPRMNGVEFLKELREDPSIAHSPVFILTTSDRQQDIDEAYRYNICGYIVKPVELGQMLEVLSTLSAYWKLCELPSDKLRVVSSNEG